MLNPLKKVHIFTFEEIECKQEFREFFQSTPGGDKIN